MSGIGSGAGPPPFPAAIAGSSTSTSFMPSAWISATSWMPRYVSDSMSAVSVEPSRSSQSRTRRRMSSGFGERPRAPERGHLRGAGRHGRSGGHVAEGLRSASGRSACKHQSPLSASSLTWSGWKDRLDAALVVCRVRRLLRLDLCRADVKQLARGSRRVLVAQKPPLAVDGFGDRLEPRPGGEELSLPDAGPIGEERRPLRNAAALDRSRSGRGIQSSFLGWFCSSKGHGSRRTTRPSFGSTRLMSKWTCEPSPSCWYRRAGRWSRRAEPPARPLSPGTRGDVHSRCSTHRRGSA